MNPSNVNPLKQKGWRNFDPLSILFSWLSSPSHIRATPSFSEPFSQPTGFLFNFNCVIYLLSMETFDCLPHPPLLSPSDTSTISTTITLHSGITWVPENRILICHHQVPGATTWRELPCQNLGGIKLKMRLRRLACYK